MKTNRALIEISLVIFPLLGFFIPFVMGLFFALVCLLGNSLPAALTWFIQGVALGLQSALVMLLIGALNVWYKWQVPQGQPKYKTIRLFNGIKVKK